MPLSWGHLVRSRISIAKGQKAFSKWSGWQHNEDLGFSGFAYQVISLISNLMPFDVDLFSTPFVLAK